MKSNYREGGYDRKYIIQKADGSPVDPKAEYFVLRIDKDPYALAAFIHYALSIIPVNPQLSEDMFKLAIEYKLIQNATEDEKRMLENKILQYKRNSEARNKN
jgi:hypothetical protein